MTKPRIQVTKNYRLFHVSRENRPLNIKKHKRLVNSMKKYGFIPGYPIVVVRDGKGNLVVKDGQHRLAIAETLGLPIYWVEIDTDFKVEEINCAQSGWGLRDYVLKHVANGLGDFETGLEFSEQHKIPIGIAFGLLAGTASHSNVISSIKDGDFKIKDQRWADAVASLYVPLVKLNESCKNARTIEACMAVCRVKDFDADRLLKNAERCREMLVSYSTRDAYLDLFEVIYNFHQRKLVGLKSQAIMAMRERDVINNGKPKEQAKQKKQAS